MIGNGHYLIFIKVEKFSWVNELVRPERKTDFESAKIVQNKGFLFLIDICTGFSNCLPIGLAREQITHKLQN